MTLKISDNILKSSGLTRTQLILEIAISFYERKILSLGKAAQFSNLHRIQFQKELADRKIAIHYSEKDLDDDLKTLENLGL